MHKLRTCSSLLLLLLLLQLLHEAEEAAASCTKCCILRRTTTLLSWLLLIGLCLLNCCKRTVLDPDSLLLQRLFVLLARPGCAAFLKHPTRLLSPP